MLARTIFMALLVVVLAGAAGAQVVEEWVARYNGPGNSLDVANSLVVDGNGNVFVTGESSGSGTYGDYATIRYNSTGQQQWVARYNGPGNHGDRANSMAVDGRGNVYVTGYSAQNSSAPFIYDYTTIKYGPSGQQQWVAHYSVGIVYWYAPKLAVDVCGNVYITGTSSGHYVTIKYNALGQQQWIALYIGPGNYFDVATSLAVDGNENVYITGWSTGIGTGYYDYATIKYNNSGQQQWVARYNGPGNGDDVATSLAMDCNGNVYVTGYSYGIGTGYYDYATIKYNNSGQQQWVTRYNGPGNAGDEAASLAVGIGGDVFVTGYCSLSSGNSNYATIKYDTSGQPQWVALYNGPGNGGTAHSLAVDINGNVYVTGRSSQNVTFPFNVDYATLKYNASGNQIWEMRYNGTANDIDDASGLAVDSYGNVYVTGWSYGIGTSNDYVTIKYSQTQPPPLDVTLIPINPPIVIAAQGGSFNFNISVVRTVGPQAPYTIWCRIKNPDETYTAPTLGPVTINTPVGVTITRQRTQTVPGSWAAGLYTYLGYVNPTFSYPAVDSSSFTFTKSATADGGPWIAEASCTGEPFPGEVTIANPTAFSLMSASPNPFNPSTVLSFELRVASQVRLTVYDTAGRLVATLVEGVQLAGMHQATFDGSNLASGIYLAKLTAGSYTSTYKLVLLK